ncbi:MAG: 50S ribosomal protein L35 [Dehalococcoidales bacterium]|jgi:large subunit ribosomal protein L35|nr:50S ribosomal protein L35 [Dehalococcoidales bacterium]MDP6222165.1 50S ribosomal protein L35 [Dehalococcoidales bacterium]MDP7110154.1 50S ribosomal protein L35 [Dehalococcoidales bacterium]MDP7309662.1 50S ribosomal protein L35 [Dehalococcoidales bacterium]MDP7409405.1 50S ribosomal protein L35 [Dehalococcoidales bacterium]
MPKIKTHKGAQKRFSITGSGKIMRTKVGKSHLRVNKSKRARGQFDEMLLLNPKDKKRIKRLVPYGV